MKNLFKFLLLIMLPSGVMAQLPARKELQVNQTTLSYYEQGEGEVIILLHGWPQTSYVWRKNFPELSKNHRVIAIDLPGLGKSLETTSYDTQNIASIINNFVDTLRIEKFHFVGHDIGSWVAVAYALKFENRLKTLTVMDAGIPGLMSLSIFQPQNATKVWQFYFHAIDEIPELLTSGKEKDYLSWYFKNKSFIKTAINKKDLQIYYHDYKGKMKNGFGYYRAFQLSSHQNQQFKQLLTIPILAIGGQYALSDQVGQALKVVGSNVDVKIVENCGHYLAEEQPKLVNNLILNHVALSKIKIE